MPQGTICQLHYLDGGTVQFQEASGSWLRLPFYNAPSLRIGQQVRFTLNSAGEACQLEALQPHAEEEPGLSQNPAQQQTPELEEQWQVAPAKRPAEKAEALGLQRQAWKLQRCIGRFQNADLEERLEMLSRAEVTLRELLQQADLDGDRICGLVCKVVGWLQAPRFSKQMPGTGGGSSEAGGTGDLQCRIRRLLISALRSLDLTDRATRQAVETAVVYIRQLIQDVCLDDVETSRAAREWRTLESLISTEGGPTVPIEDGLRSSLRSARVVQGDWSPNARVRQLPSVFAGDAVQLTCPSCPRSITSRWWWRHPKTQAVYVLIPQNGCFHGGARARREKVDETSRFRPARPADGLQTKQDCLPNLDFCHHQRKRCDCGICRAESKESEGLI